MSINFTPEKSKTMHIDLNSCFASIEQQANHFLRNKPIAVAAYDTPNGCVLAASIEAKKFGVKTGCRVHEAKRLCPQIKILTPDSIKYRYVHARFKELLSKYTDKVYPKSIDEFVLDFDDSPYLMQGLFNIGAEIKQRIRDEIGDYLKVSIGIAPSRFLAKTASNLQKPDGLSEINSDNYLEVYGRLSLLDLCGIAKKTLTRLNSHGIFTVLDLYNADPAFLKITFGSIFGYYWHYRLCGIEIEDYESDRKSFSHSYSLPKALFSPEEVTPIMVKLIEKLASRLRQNGYKTQGVSLGLRFDDGTHWHEAKKTKQVLFDTRDIYKNILSLFLQAPKKKIRLIDAGCFNLIRAELLQQDLFYDVGHKSELFEAIDKINSRWGNLVIGMSGLISSKKHKYVPDRVGFGQVREVRSTNDGVVTW